jgi:two-component system NtrC family response regulator
MIMSDEEFISAEDLELPVDAEEKNELNFDLRVVREEAERKAIQRVLTQCGGNVTQAAELLKVSRPTMYDLLNKYGLKQ